MILPFLSFEFNVFYLVICKIYVTKEKVRIDYVGKSFKVVLNISQAEVIFLQEPYFQPLPSLAALHGCRAYSTVRITFRQCSHAPLLAGTTSSAAANKRAASHLSMHDAPTPADHGYSAPFVIHGTCMNINCL